MKRPRSVFPYQPLSQTTLEGFETRLICLHPGDFNDCIYCTIYHADILKKGPQTEYTALSYVWGDVTKTQAIQLGFHPFPTSEPAHTCTSAPSLEAISYKSFEVTTNLESALRHLRSRVSERILWVDAICINQFDWEERLSQVSSMGDVYRNAMEVRIWLGSIIDVSVSMPNIQEEFENYQSRQISTPRRPSQSLLLPEDHTGADLSCKESIIEIILFATKAYVMDEGHLTGQKIGDNSLPNELESLGIRIIASQPWWRRVWVIQEATLPEQDPVMQCGHVKIRYRRFLKPAKYCMFRNAPLELSRIHISLAVHEMFASGYDPSEASLASRLLTYLGCMSGNFEVTDPRDRINGMRGMLRMADCHDNIFFLMMRDQREQSLAEYFHRVAIWILFNPEIRSYPLRILESGPSNIDGVPSWVPMWESKRWTGQNENYEAPETKYDLLARGTAMGKVYHQSSIGICDRCTAMYRKKWGAPKSVFDIDVRCTEIRIRNALALGRVITTVKVLSVQEKENIDVLREAILEVEQRILAVLRTMNIPHADAKSHIQRFRDFLRLNFWVVNTEEDAGSSEHSMTLEDFLQCKRKSRKRKSQRRGRKFSAHSANSNVSNRSSSIAKLSSFFGCVRYLVVGSNIIGSIFEDSLPSWRCGDKLYLIPECRWALGLRRSGNGYRYMYRVSVSDPQWQQRKRLFDGKGTYENIILV